MFIHLSSSAVSAAVENGTESARSLRCMERLLLAHHDGVHLLSVDPEETKRAGWRQFLARLSETARGALSRILGTAPEIAGLRDDLRYSLELGVGADFDGSVHERAHERSVIRMGLHHFDDFCRPGRAVLLCENVADADFYLALGRLLLALRSWRSLNLSCEARGGGGSQLAPELARIAEDGRIVLAIADGDVRCPGGAPGSTPTNLKETARGLPGIQHAHVLPALEVENLIPLDAYREVFEHLGNRGSQLSTVSLLKALSRAELAHADLKEGITLHQIDHTMKPGAPEHAYWQAVAARRRRTSCWRQEGECQERRECTCYVVEKLGAHVLIDVFNWLRAVGARRPRAVAERLGLTKGSALEEIAENVIAWGCAYPPLLT